MVKVGAATLATATQVHLSVRAGPAAVLTIIGTAVAVVVVSVV